MKKKSLLGILAILMVIALAITGCGQQQGEQNAGATGSESQNGTIANNGNASNGKAMAEPEDSKNVGDEASNHNPKMKDGYYVYEVLGEEFLCKTNVWDYIDEDAKTFDFVEMTDSLGLDSKYFVGDLALMPPYLSGGAKAHYQVVTFTDSTHTKVDTKKTIEYTIKYSSDTMAQSCYYAGGDPNYGMTLDLIILSAYGCENMKKDISSPPLGDHLQQYYNTQTSTYELP